MKPTVYRAWQRNRERAMPTNSTAWRNLRAAVLRDEPLCRHCRAQGRITPGRDVDHIDGNDANNDRSNLQPLCQSCHSVKTATEQMGGKRKLKGWFVPGETVSEGEGGV